MVRKKGKNGENTYTLNKNILLPIILGLGKYRLIETICQSEK